MSVHGEAPRAGRASSPTATSAFAASSLRQHHFVPGFPIMAWPMVEWVLDRRYTHLVHRQAEAEASIVVYDSAES